MIMAKDGSVAPRERVNIKYRAATGDATGSLLEEILAETKMTPGDEGYEIAKRGVQAFIAELISPKREGEKVDKAFVDAL
jgi:predicted component of type VI protein secretion system